MTYIVEHTDTFCGEANYSWVNRLELDLPKDATDRQIVIAAKDALGLKGVRHTKNDYGDCIELRWPGLCQVTFITYGQA